MRPGPLAFGGALLLAAVVAAASWFAPAGPGAAWDDPSPAGHSALVEQLSLERPVRIVEGSLNLLPPEAGEGDTLFLFPTYRPSAPLERSRVAAFAQDGGTVVVAADGGHAADWFAALGLDPPHRIPVLLAPGTAAGCVRVDLPLPGAPAACLPSPASFRPEDLKQPPQGLEFLANATSHVLLDLDGDGELGLGDQGPLPLPMALGWRLGAGRVIAIADGDLWRNGVLEAAPENLELASSLAGFAGTVYLDGTGAFGDGASLPVAHRTLSSPGTAQAAALALLPLAVLAACLLAPRARAWLPHRHGAHQEDPALEARAAGILAPTLDDKSPEARP